MKRHALLFLVAALATGCLADEGYRPLRDLRSFKLKEGERREVTGWFVYRKMILETPYALLREESHVFPDGARGISYTVFDTEFNELGRIGAGGEVKKFIKHRRTQAWREISLGNHEISLGVSLLLGQTVADRTDTEIVALTLADVTAVKQ